MKSCLVTAARKEMDFRLNEANEWAQFKVNERSSASDVRVASERLARVTGYCRKRYVYRNERGHKA
jgi:hypothetical protein